MSGPEISAFFYDLPLIVKCVIVPSALLVACSILRIVSNCLPSQRPPVFEGIPFIGGVLKFVQVMRFREIDKMCTKQAYSERVYAGQTGNQVWMYSVNVLMHQGPNQLLQKGYKKYGEVFTVPVLNKNITFLIGTDVTPFFFKATDEEMSQQEVQVCQLLLHSSNG